MTTVNFDDVIRHVGDFGRYQKYVYSLICALCIHTGIINFSTLFTGYIPNHRCKILGWDGDTYHIQNENHSAAINATIPVVYDNNSLATGWSPCLMNTNNGTLAACTDWVYDTSIFTSTIVSALCSEMHGYMAYAMYTISYGVPRCRFTAHATSAICVTGSLLTGNILHFWGMIGRRYCILIAVIIYTLSGSLTAVSPNVFFAMALFFLTGLGTEATYLVAFGLGLEFVGKSKRFHAGIIVNYLYAIGVMIEALFSYLVRDWRHLQLLSVLPATVFISYFWLLPDSPRWLINRNRHVEAWAIIKRMAKANNTEVDKTLLRDATKKHPQKTVKIWLLFRHRSLTITYFIIMLNWITCALLYYGLSLNSGDLVGSIHLNLFLTGLMEIVGYFFSHVFVNRLGRKWVFVVSILFGGIACLLTIFPVIYLSTGYEWLIIVLAMLGKLGATSAFAMVIIYTAEIFPTVIRTSGLGVASMVARIGSIISPYIADLSLVIGGRMGRALPLMIFGAVAVTSGLASLYLPETLNKPLPDTFEDCKNFRRKSRANGEVINGEETVQLDDYSSRSDLNIMQNL